MTGRKVESANNLGLSMLTLYRWLPASGQAPQLH
jgi:hypothetical protein